VGPAPNSMKPSQIPRELHLWPLHKRYLDITNFTELDPSLPSAPHQTKTPDISSWIFSGHHRLGSHHWTAKRKQSHFWHQKM